MEIVIVLLFAYGVVWFGGSRVLEHWLISNFNMYEPLAAGIAIVVMGFVASAILFGLCVYSDRLEEKIRKGEIIPPSEYE